MALTPRIEPFTVQILSFAAQIKNFRYPAKGGESFLCGTRDRIRTYDPRFRRPMLYPAELRVLLGIHSVCVVALRATLTTSLCLVFPIKPTLRYDFSGAPI